MMDPASSVILKYGDDGVDGDFLSNLCLLRKNVCRYGVLSEAETEACGVLYH